MERNNNAIHRALMQQRIPHLPQAFNHSVMMQIRRRERYREIAQNILCGVAIVTIFSGGVLWLLQRYDIHFDLSLNLPDISFSQIDFSHLKSIAIISVCLIALLLIDSYLRLKMYSKFLFKDNKK